MGAENNSCLSSTTSSTLRNLPLNGQGSEPIGEPFRSLVLEEVEIDETLRYHTTRTSSPFVYATLSVKVGS